MRLLIVATCAGCDSTLVVMCRSQTRPRAAWNDSTTDNSRTGTTAWNSSSWEPSEEADRRTAGGMTTYSSTTGGGRAQRQQDRHRTADGEREKKG
ncbi:ATP-dependent zinc metalloprotease FtsH [Sesbania bispinosa]|nr:ATP-dependent zinc metalloprotease FtsH [Sesbania bispinosa]